MMTTQERLQAYQTQLSQRKDRARQLAGQMAELQEAIDNEQQTIATLGGAVQALREELRSQQEAEKVEETTKDVPG
jgi:predicted  nucleic acid-binding Zn-ribbon protein